MQYLYFIYFDIQHFIILHIPNIIYKIVQLCVCVYIYTHTGIYILLVHPLLCLSHTCGCCPWCLYLSTASVVSWDNMSLRDSITWMVSLTTGVYRSVQGLPPPLGTEHLENHRAQLLYYTLLLPLPLVSKTRLSSGDITKSIIVLGPRVSWYHVDLQVSLYSNMVFII